MRGDEREGLCARKLCVRKRSGWGELMGLCGARALHVVAGTNHGSLSARVLSFYGDTPRGMVESAIEYVARVLNLHCFSLPGSRFTDLASLSLHYAAHIAQLESSGSHRPARIDQLASLRAHRLARVAQPASNSSHRVTRSLHLSALLARVTRLQYLSDAHL